MTTPIFFNPVLQEKIWGGTKLQSLFHFPIPSDKTGEAWIISAHPHGVSTVKSPSPYAGMGLDELYKQHPELFNGQHLKSFPLLIKLLDAADDLSVQVHPDDAYALSHEGEYGKNECWYVVQAEPGAKIVYGHSAMTKEEFTAKINEEAWNELFTEVPVKAGDFFNVPSGTIHAIGGGIVILETQQNSDTTYRVYDYHRKDNSGNLRPLHIQQTIDVTTIPHSVPTINQQVVTTDTGIRTTFVENKFFTVWKYDIDGDYSDAISSTYHLVTVLDGNGMLTVDGTTYPIEKADSFILPSGTPELKINGSVQLIVSQSNQ